MKAIPKLGAKLAGFYVKSESKMTKKDSIFKWLGTYFRSHPSTVLGWLWVSIAPLAGSLFLTANYHWLEQVKVESFGDHLLLTLALALVVGLALLPTTFTALAAGFFWGWIVFPDLLIGYLLANVLGYSLGKALHADFKPFLYARNPHLQEEIEKRVDRPASLVFFVRISPIVPFAISNFLFASLAIPLRKILLFGVPGMLPRTCLAFASGRVAQSFLGAQESLQQPAHWALLALFLAGSAVGILRFWMKPLS